VNPNASLYPSWHEWTLEEQGENRANNGTKELEKWFLSLSDEQRESIKTKLPDWKRTAKLRIPWNKND
jgi:hypothetical protein